MIKKIILSLILLLFFISTSYATDFDLKSNYGFIQSLAPIWSGARSGGTLSVTTGSVDVGSQFIAGPNLYFIWRTYLFFDTSSIPDDATITSAKLHIDDCTGGGTTEALYLVNISTDDHTLVTSDWSTMGSTMQSDDTPTPVFDGATDITFTLNSTGIGNISKTGTTKFGLRGTRDYNNNAPVGAYQSVLGTSPLYLEVNYTSSYSGNVNIVEE